ncbi:hypothetical protein Taro_026006 [Colocasia esculenta]|uniref:Uncharacterized protein n=1 Tax=Colocasia esculenta TaxID=4460 RepID=A0A843VFW1_COLES|nr:hypothetical protein [Colocasia esculenta]
MKEDLVVSRVVVVPFRLKEDQLRLGVKILKGDCTLGSENLRYCSGTGHEEEKFWTKSKERRRLGAWIFLFFFVIKLGLSYSTKKVSRIMTTLTRMGPMRRLRSDHSATSAI